MLSFSLSLSLVPPMFHRSPLLRFKQMETHGFDASANTNVCNENSTLAQKTVVVSFSSFDFVFKRADSATPRRCWLYAILTFSSKSKGKAEKKRLQKEKKMLQR